MDKNIADLIRFAEGIGFTCEGKDSHNHYVLRHAAGEYRIPSTPGEYRGFLNAKTAMRRIAGVKNDSPAHRRSRKAFRPSGFNLNRSDAEAEASSEIDALLDEHCAVTDRLAEIALNPRRRDLPEAHLLATRQVAIEGRLTELHQPIPRTA